VGLVMIVSPSPTGGKILHFIRYEGNQSPSKPQQTSAPKSSPASGIVDEFDDTIPF
jgi:hypothetical protein